MPPKRRVVRTVRGARKTPPSKAAASPPADAASPETPAAPAAATPSPESAAAEASGDATPPPVAPTTEPSTPEATPQAATSEAPPLEPIPEPTENAGTAVDHAAGIADAAPVTTVAEPMEASEGAAEVAAKPPVKKVTTKVRKVTRRVPVRRSRPTAGMESEEKVGDTVEGRGAVPMETAEQEGNPNGAACSESTAGNGEKGGENTENIPMETTEQEGNTSGALSAEAAKEIEEKGVGEGNQEARPMETTEQEVNPSIVICSEAAVSASAEQIEHASNLDKPSEPEKSTSNAEVAVSAAASTDGAAPAVVSKKRVRKVTIKRIVKKPKIPQKEEKKQEAEVGATTGKRDKLDSDVNNDEPSKAKEPGVEVKASTVSNGALQVSVQEDVITQSVEHGSGNGGTGESVEAEEGKGVDVCTGGGSTDDVVEGVTERQKRRKTEIFIGGLDRGAKEEDIRKVFGKVGEIVEVRLMMDGKTGKNKGYAFLRYANATQAKQAVSEFAKVEVCGKQCGAAALEGNDTIFLGNIDKKWKKDDVMKLLNELGIEKIDTVTLMPDPNNADCNRGFAFLELETNRDAQIAFKKLQKKDVFGKGRNVKVAWAEPLNDPDEEEMQKVKSVYVEGIPSSWDEKKVRECFKKFGQIERVVLSRNMHSAKRKDFAFINFTSRESALSCIESFDKEDLSDNGSKVNLKVSLAKPVPKGKQNKAIPKSGQKDSSKEKPKAVQRETKVTISNTSQAFKGPHGAVVGSSASTTQELLHVLREQASWKQGQPGYPIGAANPGYMLVSHEGKRPFSALGDDPYSDTRGYPHARMDSAYPVASTSYGSLSHNVPNASLPQYQQQNVRYGTGSIYGSADSSRTFQMKQGSAPRGSGLYSR